jgi:nucleoside phosphorylase
VQALKGRVHFGIITVRPDEFRAVLSRFRPEQNDVVSGELEYNISRVMALNGQTYTCAMVRSLEQGNQHAQRVANALIEELAPRWLLVVGIAGGLPSNDFTLGDVILSSRIYDLTVEAQRPDSSVEYDLRGGSAHPDVQAILANLPAREHLLEGWNSPANLQVPRPQFDLTTAVLEGEAEWRNKVQRSLETHFSTKKASLRLPRFIDQPIASSDRLVRYPPTVQTWAKVARRIAAVEMEAAGVFQAAARRHQQYPVLAVRGLSDIIGLQREDDWLDYACHTAASFVYHFVRMGPFEAQLNT